MAGPCGTGGLWHVTDSDVTSQARPSRYRTAGLGLRVTVAERPARLPALSVPTMSERALVEDVYVRILWTGLAGTWER
jgi:hypothetical protein